MAKYSVEKSAKIFNDVTGKFISIGPDRDGLDLVEIIDEDNNKIVISQEEALLIAKVLSEIYKND